MFALVESGSITKYFSGNRGITIGDNQYPKEIFTLWSKSEREAIGIYEVEMDTSKSCLLYTSPSPRDGLLSRMPSSA